MNIINVSKEAYNKIKKHKKLYYVISDDLKLSIGDKVLIKYDNKKKEKTIKNIYTSTDNINAKYIYNIDNPKGNTMVEFIRSKKIIRRSLLAILLLLVLFVGGYFTINFIRKILLFYFYHFINLHM